MCKTLYLGAAARIKTNSGIIGCFFLHNPAIMFPHNNASLGEQSKWQAQNHQ
nr:MAG TPA: hypothetical protein [Caudoviricetes sp.]